MTEAPPRHAAPGTRLVDTDVLERLAPELVASLPPARRELSPPVTLSVRARLALTEVFFRHRASLVWLVPVLVLAAVLHGWNMHHSPGPNDDEGTYVSQAWAFQEHGELSHYTYWYDHPPLGWLLLAAWNTVFAVLPRGASLLYAGRDAMLVVHLVSCVAMFTLARRMHVRRWAAALAVLLFTVSPLGLEWQRLTLLDNIGTPLLISGWALALTPRCRLVAYAGSGLLIGSSILVKETNALFLAPVTLQLWFAARGRNRSYALVLFAGAVLSVSGLYPLFAALKNELIPGPGHVSLLWAIQWQLFSRAPSGSPFQPGSGTRLAIEDWLNRDGLLLLTALVSVPLVAWRRPRLRPLALLVLILMAMPLRGGYLPAPYPINLVWPCALLAAGGADLRRSHVRRSRRQPAHWIITATAATLVTAVTGHALIRDRAYLVSDQDREYRQAQSWLLAHTKPSDVMLVDNTIWIDLIQQGYPRQNVIWFYKFDLDPAVQALHPGGWRAIDYVVESSIMGATAYTLPETSAAIEHGKLIAEFGDIHVYRVV